MLLSSGGGNHGITGVFVEIGLQLGPGNKSLHLTDKILTWFLSSLRAGHPPPALSRDLLHPSARYGTSSAKQSWIFLQ